MIKFPENAKKNICGVLYNLGLFVLLENNNKKIPVEVC